MGHSSTIRKEVRTLRDDGRGKILFAVSAGSFLIVGVQMIYPVMLPELRVAYGLNLGTAGLLLTLLWAANAIGQIPSGILADEIGEKRTLLLSVVLSAVTIVLIVSFESSAALFASTVLLGAGLALFGVARYTIMYETYPDRAGTTIGIVLAAADAGQSLLPPLASVLTVVVAWQLGFGFTIPIFILIAVTIWLYIPREVSSEKQSSEHMSLSRFAETLSMMYTKRVIFATTIFVIYVCVWVSFTSFYPTYLIESKNIPQTTTAILFGSFFAAGVVIKPLSGAIYDRVGIRRTLMVLAPISALALIAFPLAEGVLPIAVITLLVAPLLGSGTIAQSYLIEIFTHDVRGTGLGIIRTCGLLIGSTTPAIFGFFAEIGYFDEGFLALALLIGTMITLIMLLPSK
ncbi:MFS transporter [Natronomonas salsuginis]|uniref:MFS transporter n=1 Tax=Natronomonas salsuginis TaxID=2217661 RepID=UPI001C9E4369|nr:MFS transporter [Natronomonas salsuginis]